MNENNINSIESNMNICEDFAENLEMEKLNKSSRFNLGISAVNDGMTLYKASKTYKVSRH
jgi:hypothetical protein